MFTYTLSGKTIENGKNRITVEYSDGTIKCSDTFFFSSKEELDNRITGKIAELDKVVLLDATLVTEGYVKAEPKIVTPPTDLELAEAELYRLKNLINIGVMKETEPEFIAAVSAYKTAAGTVVSTK